MKILTAEVGARRETALVDTRMGDIIYLSSDGNPSDNPTVHSRIYRVANFIGRGRMVLERDRFCVPVDCSGPPIHIAGIAKGILLRPAEVQLIYRFSPMSSPLRHLKPGDVFEYGDLETENQWQVIPDADPQGRVLLAICIFGVSRGLLCRFDDMNRQTQWGDEVTLKVVIEL